MIRFLLRNAFRFIVLILLQYVFNLIQFTPLNISPLFYIVFILLLPFETPGWILVLSAFFLGLGIDWQQNTFGQHAFASVLIAGLRPFVLQFIAERDEYEKGTLPRLVYFGFGWALRYALIMSLIHALTLYTLEAFSFVDYWRVLLKTGISTLLTSALIIMSQYWVFRKVV